MKSRFPLLYFLSMIILLHNSHAQSRESQELSSGWKFYQGQQDQAFQKNFDDSGWEDVTVPHDWAIKGPFIADGDGNTGKLPWKGEGWYRLKLDVEGRDQGKRIYLLFDGVMAFPEVYVNGSLAGRWDYGYNSFNLDITDFLEFGGDNILAVHADTRNHDSRWYPGAGIYRKVRLIKVNPVHVDIWGTYITTPIIKPHYADVGIMTTIDNHNPTDKELLIKHIILTDDDIKVGDAEMSVNVAAGSTDLFQQTITVPDPRRWDIQHPHLYTLKTELYDQNELVDTYYSTFGVRNIRFTANEGFYLNDRRVQLKGVNLHHDHGPLGAAFNLRAMERQLEIMKDMGCNAVRTSHNTPAPELLELCDRMGILVFEEVFDKYDGKADILDTTDFENFTHRNIRNFVVRDRNHPSIFLWSVGNEIGDVQWNKDNGFYRLRTMINYVEKYDHTRPKTLVCDSEEGAKNRHFDFYDIHSWNYGRRYWLARKLEPDKSVIIAESASTVSTRGFYEFPLPEEKTDFTQSLQVSSYDLNAPWWAEIPDDDFMWQQQESYVAGEFVWTGFDYLGEPTPYSGWFLRQMDLPPESASRSSYFGIVDLCGIPKDRYFLYKSYWNPDETTVHILPHWNWQGKEGDTIPVFVYTNGQCGELFLNGRSMGKKCKDPKSDNSIERFRLMWNDVIYEPGELKAVAYKEGKVIGEAVMKTAGMPVSLHVTADRNYIVADGKDLSYILVEALDKDGNLYPLADQKVEVKLKGPGRLAGVCNGNPQSMNSFKSSSVSLFYGKAMIVVSSGLDKGELDIEVSAKGLRPAKLSITVE